jgi:enamine deaminase RidA (YjgF/YER057c/UK114 family)
MFLSRALNMSRQAITTTAAPGTFLASIWCWCQGDLAWTQKWAHILLPTVHLAEFLAPRLNSAAAVGTYSQAIKANGMVFCSGQVHSFALHE